MPALADCAIVKGYVGCTKKTIHMSTKRETAVKLEFSHADGQSNKFVKRVDG